MTPRPDLVRLAAQTLSESPSERSASREADAKAVAIVAKAIRARRRQGDRLRWVVRGVAVAAGLVLAIGSFRMAFRSAGSTLVARTPVGVKSPALGLGSAVVDDVVGEAYVLHGGQSQSAIAGTSMGAGDQLVVEHGAGVTLVLPTGTRVTAEEGADLTVVAEGPTQLFRLSTGSMRADVEKLKPGERFVVRTPDVEIEVRGTSFRVANVASDPSCGAGTTTRLGVDHGIVVVRSGATETRVHAGQVWPSGCRGEPASSSESPVPTAPPAPPPSATHSMGLAQTNRVSDVLAPGSARSQLAEQNDLYGRAIEARDRGDSEGAIVRFESLFEKYPAAPLAENAMVERMKVLASTDDVRAADAAKAYLARYPTGAARADAETILAMRKSGR